MLNCDRCGLYAKGESSICYRTEVKYNKEDYEIDNINKANIISKWKIVSGYESEYDMCDIEFSKQFDDLNNLKEAYPWVGKIGDAYNNLCDECITEMLINKDLVSTAGLDGLTFPFYTSCCNKLYLENNLDVSELYEVRFAYNFPYLSAYYIIEEKYMCLDSLPFTYHDNCIVCKECISNKLKNHEIQIDDPIINYDSPIYFTLKQLFYRVEQYIPFEMRGKYEQYEQFQVHESISDDFNVAISLYKSKKNNLLIKKELEKYIIKRNLDIIRSKYFISKDIIALMLENG